MNLAWRGLLIHSLWERIIVGYLSTSENLNHCRRSTVCIAIRTLGHLRRFHQQALSTLIAIQYMYPTSCILRARTLACTVIALSWLAERNVSTQGQYSHFGARIYATSFCWTSNQQYHHTQRCRFKGTAERRILLKSSSPEG